MKNSQKGFAGLRVLSLESRRGPEMAKLIFAHGGKPMVAPAMREIPLESNTAALDFGRRLLEGEFDAIIFLTGVGTRALAQTPAASTDKPAAAAAAKTTAKTKAPRTAKSLECSKQADAKGLHGKERKKFRSECKKG